MSAQNWLANTQLELFNFRSTVPIFAFDLLSFDLLS